MISVDVGQALAALWSGAFGSPQAVLSATLVRATPLILMGVAVAVAFRAGVLNIGTDGQFLAGAVAATVVAIHAERLSPFLVIAAMLGAGVLGGGLWAAIAATLRWRFGVLEVVTTLLLNFVASSLVAWLVRGPLQEPTHAYPQSAPFVTAAHWPFLLRGYRLHAGFAVAVVAAVGAWWVLSRTAFGLRLRAVGAGSAAAASAGLVNVPRVLFTATVASGALAGVAGAVEVGGVTWALFEKITPGFGYTAIAVALLARLEPRLIIASGVLFGALLAGAANMEREAGVPSDIASVVVAVVLLFILLVPAMRRFLGARRARRTVA